VSWNRNFYSSISLSKNYVISDMNYFSFLKSWMKICRLFSFLLLYFAFFFLILCSIFSYLKGCKQKIKGRKKKSYFENLFLTEFEKREFCLTSPLQKKKQTRIGLRLSHENHFINSHCGCLQERDHLLFPAAPVS